MIQPLTIADLEAVMAIEAESFPFPWTDAMMRAEFEKENALCFGFKKAERLCAYIISWMILDELHIGSIAVRRRHRRKGIARELMDYAIREAQCKSVWLEVSDRNPTAITAYQRMGFRSYNTRDRYYEDGSNAILMMKLIRR